MEFINHRTFLIRWKHVLNAQHKEEHRYNGVKHHIHKMVAIGVECMHQEVCSEGQRGERTVGLVTVIAMDGAAPEVVVNQSRPENVAMTTN